MKNGIVVQVIGAIFILLALGNLIGLFFSEVRELIENVPAVLVRYSLMFASGIGLLLRRKWGAYLFGIAVPLNWIVFYMVYSGTSALVPLWVSLAGPLLIAGVFYASWSSLK